MWTTLLTSETRRPTHSHKFCNTRQDTRDSAADVSGVDERFACCCFALSASSLAASIAHFSFLLLVARPSFPPHYVQPRLLHSSSTHSHSTSDTCLLDNFDSASPPLPAPFPYVGHWKVFDFGLLLYGQYLPSPSISPFSTSLASDPFRTLKSNSKASFPTHTTATLSPHLLVQGHCLSPSLFPRFPLISSLRVPRTTPCIVGRRSPTLSPGLPHRPASQPPCSSILS